MKMSFRAVCRVTLTAAVSLMLLAIAAAPAPAQWGTLKGRFVYKGKPFQQVPEVVQKDKDYCGPFNIKKPTPQIGPKGGVGGLLVWLYLENNDPTPKIKPGRKMPAAPVLDNIKCMFAPNATLVRTGQQFTVKNSDKIPHSVATTFLNNRAQSGNKNLPAGAAAKYTLQQRERIPTPVTCGFHPWMKAFLVVTDHPYAVITEPDGTFEITDLPIGLHTIQVRHLVGRGGYVDDVIYQGKPVKWAKGKIGQIVAGGQNKVGIPAGKVVDLGDIEVQPAVFK